MDSSLVFTTCPSDHTNGNKTKKPAFSCHTVKQRSESMATPERDTVYTNDGNRTVYTRESSGTGWFVGIIVALALLAIGYLVFSANSGPATSTTGGTPAIEAPADPALAPAPMTEAPAAEAPAAAAPAATAPAAEAPAAVEAAPAAPAATTTP
jgi:cytoskeletal protein RodZ